MPRFVACAVLENEDEPMDFAFIALVVVFWLLLAGMAVGCAKLGGPDAMSWMVVLGAVVSVALLIYLVAALLQPEKFS